MEKLWGLLSLIQLDLLLRKKKGTLGKTRGVFLGPFTPPSQAKQEVSQLQMMGKPNVLSDVNVGDSVVVGRNKTTIRPPCNPQIVAMSGPESSSP